MEHDTLVITIGAVVTVLAQVVVAPNIMLFGVMPNLLVVYSVVVSMLTAGRAPVVLAFVMGVLGDCLGFGPLGALPLLLLVVAFLGQRLMEAYGTAQLSASLVVMAVQLLLVEVFYAFFMVAMNGMPLVDALVYRALPEAVYDCAFGLLAFPLLQHLLSGGSASMGAPTPRPRIR